MKIKRILLFGVLINFSLISAQISEINDVDKAYHTKISELKQKLKNKKEFKNALSGLNKDRIIALQNIIQKYHTSDSLEIANREAIKTKSEINQGMPGAFEIKNATAEAPKDSETKPVSYKNGGIGRFRTDLSQSINFEEMPDFYDYPRRTLLSSRLHFTITKTGEIKNVSASGDHKDFNTIAIAALYKTSGNWIAKEKDGEKIDSSFVFPVQLMVQ